MTRHNPPISLGLIIGIDWADREHEAFVISPKTGRGELETVEHSPEAIDTWVNDKLKESGGQPIGILLEQHRGALMHALMHRENVLLYFVNPKQSARYRESYSNAGAKSDRTDARLLARMLLERNTQMSPWQPDDEPTRTLARLCEARRNLVNQRTRLVQQLTSHLKSYFPLILGLGTGKSLTPLRLELVRRWPDPRKLKRTDPRLLHKVLAEAGCRSEKQRNEIIAEIRSATLLTTDRALIEPLAVVVQTLARQIPTLQKGIDQLEKKIAEEMRRHPDAALFEELPGAGAALAPRLLAAFGSRRDRYEDADQVATFSGIAPVSQQSGKTRMVRRRRACPRFLLQTFHEFADQARRWCPWSKTYYKMQVDRGMGHHAALRKLASRWIRILFRVWKSRTPYDPDRYLAAISRKNPKIRPYLEAQKKAESA